MNTKVRKTAKKKKAASEIGRPKIKFVIEENEHGHFDVKYLKGKNLWVNCYRFAQFSHAKNWIKKEGRKHFENRQKRVKAI